MLLRNMSPSAISFLRPAALAALVSSTLVAGCAYGEMPQVLRAQVANEASCPDLVVRKAASYAPGYKDNQYTVRGCGIDRIYTCNGDAGGLVKFGSADCSYVARGAAAQPAQSPAPAAGPAAEPDTDPGLDTLDGAGEPGNG